MRSPGLLIAVTVLLVCPSAALHAQELEPRAYSPSPIGTNFLAAGYSHTSGDVLVDPSVPVTDLEARIDTALLGYLHTFGLFGRSASLGGVLPRAWLNATGNVGGEGREVTRDGLADPRLRLAVNLLGGPAVTPAEFAAHRPARTLGASLSVVAPFGQYDEERLINIGANRWAFKPEIGLSQPIGDAFLEASLGAWLFMDNTDFFGGRRREQETLWSFQLHGGYSFRPGLWIAGDANFYTGGGTRTDGVQNLNRQENSRYGLTLAVPLSKSFSAKLAWSTGLTTRIGGDFDVYALVMQYRWFDHPPASAIP